MKRQQNEWAPLNPATVAANFELRRRFGENPASLSAEDLARAEVLSARSARKRQKRESRRQCVSRANVVCSVQPISSIIPAKISVKVPASTPVLPKASKLKPKPSKSPTTRVSNTPTPTIKARESHPSKKTRDRLKRKEKEDVISTSPAVPASAPATRNVLQVEDGLTLEEVSAVGFTGLTLSQLGAADAKDLQELFEEKGIKGSVKILIKSALTKLKAGGTAPLVPTPAIVEHKNISVPEAGDGLKCFLSKSTGPVDEPEKKSYWCGQLSCPVAGKEIIGYSNWRAHMSKSKKRLKKNSSH